MDDLAALLPPGPKGVCDVSRDFIANREVDFVSNFLRLFERIDACRDERDTELLKLSSVLCVADQLPAAIRSPVTSIEQDDLPICLKATRKRERLAADELQRQRRKRRADPKFV